MILNIKVVPKSSKNSFSWYEQDKNIFKLCITAPPVDGKANEAIIEFLSDFFDIRKKQVQIETGKTAKLKRVKLDADEKYLLEKIKTIL
ncbi:MAG TPA: YggU family protein [Spirochaetia bacterium]|nr:MAG: YggU family protein [Spirochaetes bacterium GWB1_36_13]HCL56497.1 YggU family protein [Spirochaetia bacterium]